MPCSPPQITVRKISVFDLEPVWFQQGWLAQPEPDFRPACVRVACSHSALLVYAELEDADIFNPITEENASSYKHGDVFEIFLRPLGQEVYFEFHVSPQNQRLQIRIPNAETMAAVRAKIRKTGGDVPPEMLMHGPAFSTRTEVFTGQEKWRVFAEVPFELVAENGVQNGSQWLFSFSRYDYTRGRKKPVFSSTSPHAKIDFHRQQEWGTLTFELD